ncbi:DNA-directed RNA polymerase subunit beta [Candidatus Gottesmanbacteria bacterium RIFCSPLOWO2_01_FULL_48_11]|uniref:DNA-directed RNA polymerase subunit beta n=3 Tax=Candidatus Gottesmaniibacteriota TaxID=1752720 RepID=A0A0G1UP16_9BACT|nr:MAG: DNA-directed RNA polymerase subunit beta [Candidatus Gottesmanbacteria bacterium GW2011_GWA2_47_9]KKU95879.1 MAG: DNA-directed RNA polymerase subunit beta [Candidatus Gottesmanbacteria bacterium GW2011_GWA1_48_13]OGG26582.1 MAG: DNA-directed RNA polymerase subunit beta [Candidatus Gottesmanbacteria bacterium RIFCSPLOWO2_01_FULL_48_11]
MAASATHKRLYWGKTYRDLPPLDLTLVQRESYQWFLESAIRNLLLEVSPISDFTGKNWTLSFGDYYFGRPRLTPEKALEKGLTYDMPLKTTATLVNKQSGHQVTQEVFLGDIPAMTANGTFIINGIERCVVNQLVRSPGIYFTGQIDTVTGRTLYSAEIRPMHGSWLEFIVTRNNVLMVRIDRRRKFVATTFLRAIGMGSDEEIAKTFADVDTSPDHKYIEATLAKDPTKTQVEAVLELYRKLRPGEPIVVDNAQELLRTMFFDYRRYSLERVGRYKMNKKLGIGVPNDKEHWVLTRDDIIGSLKYLINVGNGIGDVDDIDHLGNRRVRRVGELVATNAFRVGLLRLERSVREKMSLAGPAAEDLTPMQLINARPIIASINDFFRTSQLSTILDQTNPLAEVDNLRRLTVMGVGGISRERASFSIRDINASQYGRICPVRSPEGPNIGLVTYMSLYARVNEYGFLETPYRKVEKINRGGKAALRVTNDIVYLDANDEQYHYITHAGIPMDKDEVITEERLPVRYKGEFLEGDAVNVEYIDVVPRQVVGAPASLIPFIAHDEANRALMGTHMQCQAVPLLNPEAPIVGTGMEDAIAQTMGRVVKASEEGVVVSADGATVVVKNRDGEEDRHTLEKFKRSAQSTCYNQRVLVSTGDRVQAGDVLIEGPASEGSELALGANLTIAYMSFDGLGYEDAIVISDRLVKEDVLTSVHIEEYEASVVDTKLGPEETTRDIPNVGEEALRNLDESGIVVVGAEVGPNDILVGKIAPKGETELTAEERLLRAIFGEKAREVRDTSLRIPHGERGTVIEVKILDKEQGDELEPGTNRKIIIKVAQMRKVVVGDKLAGRHGNKGVISKIVPTSDMPYTADGTIVDIIISPLSVLSRMNLGQLLEAHLGFAAKKLNLRVALPVFEAVSEANIVSKLEEAGLSVTGKDTLYDGRTGEAFSEPVVVGIGYIMKLIHMVEDKTHARSTGPYSLVTQQPLGGKAQMGGQRLGEMEVWALEAHRASHILQEMLTIKSDDVVGRAKAFEAIVKGMDIPESTVPESFKVLVKELQALGLHVTPTGVVTAKPAAPATTPADEVAVATVAQDLAKASGQETVAEN